MLMDMSVFGGNIGYGTGLPLFSGCLARFSSRACILYTFWCNFTAEKSTHRAAITCSKHGILASKAAGRVDEAEQRGCGFSIAMLARSHTTIPIWQNHLSAQPQFNSIYGLPPV